jgi:predicted O-methyltransferase YrrM
MSDPYTDALAFNPVEQRRFETLKAAISPWRTLFAGKSVLDFGASWGLSAVAFIRLGAAAVVGVEPNAERVTRGQRLLADVGLADRIQLCHVPDTSDTGLTDRFDFVSVVAVLEHIPAPRTHYLHEMWRVTASGGHLFVHETPNKYWPREDHTTQGLWFNHWLPSDLAYRRAVRQGRFDRARSDWDTSGWRGLGYYEMVKPLERYTLVPEASRFRHRALRALGLPASLFDPYPTWVLRKE